jgi:MauM/NapG family ferredoxin protein
MNEKLLTREEFLKSGLRKIGNFIKLISRESHDKMRSSLIRPPGAVKESTFLELCNKCGLCADVCPKNIICSFDDENDMAYGTPVVVPSADPCDFCKKCIEACKTGALQNATDIEILKLGIAVIDKKNCLNWSEGIICNLCKYRCPQDAIVFKNSRFPLVIRSRCNGCGLCQYICPASPGAVVIVKDIDSD